MSLIYLLIAFILGLALGWLLWGRLQDQIASLQSQLQNSIRENNRSKTELDQVRTELEGCVATRQDLTQQLDKANIATSKLAQQVKPAEVLKLASTSTEANVKTSPAPAAKRQTTKAKAPAVKEVVVKASEKDNLRRLIGIGPVNERRLNEHGITTFAQIAAWTAADVKRVEEYLQFDGRIKREKWVQQAKLLAAGKETEFARKFPSAAGSTNT